MHLKPLRLSVKKLALPIGFDLECDLGWSTFLHMRIITHEKTLKLKYVTNLPHFGRICYLR